MRSRICVLALFGAAALLGQYRLALPGYHYEFPRDYFNHPDYQTEWWYYTGNLKTPDGHRFGFELTFFRQAVSRGKPVRSPWTIDDVWLAHLALSDIGRHRFYHTSRLNRSGAGFAGADLAQRRIWNGNWQALFTGSGQRLQAISDEFSFDLAAESKKPPVIHGTDGISQKAAGAGHASHYVSFTRLETQGTITLAGKRYEVSGSAWMDHEFFTHQLEDSQVGWDWLSLQLDDDSELMLFRIRRKDGGIDPFSAGTYVDPQGHSRHLARADFSLEPQRRWTSPDTRAAYPVAWSVLVPSLGLALEVSTPLDSQEFASRNHDSPSYWEGAIDVNGRRSGSSISGVGYLEMTGYDRAARF